MKNTKKGHPVKTMPLKDLIGEHKKLIKDLEDAEEGHKGIEEQIQDQKKELAQYKKEYTGKMPQDSKQIKKTEELEKASDKPFHGYNKKRHSPTGGLNASFREKYNREHGSNLKAPVTEKNPTGKKAARKKSFCARMSGVPGPTSKEGKLTPKGAALKRWRCAKNDDVAKDDGIIEIDPQGRRKITEGVSEPLNKLKERWLQLKKSLDNASSIKKLVEDEDLEKPEEQPAEMMEEGAPMEGMAQEQMPEESEQEGAEEAPEESEGQEGMEEEMPEESEEGEEPSEESEEEFEEQPEEESEEEPSEGEDEVSARRGRLAELYQKEGMEPEDWDGLDVHMEQGLSGEEEGINPAEQATEEDHPVDVHGGPETGHNLVDILDPKQMRAKMIMDEHQIRMEYLKKELDLMLKLKEEQMRGELATAAAMQQAPAKKMPPQG